MNRTPQTVAEPPPNANVGSDARGGANLDALVRRLSALRADLLAVEASAATLLGRLDPTYRASGRNLAHYLALRRHDLRDVQEALAALGASSLGRCESHVLANVDAVLRVLRALAGTAPEASGTGGVRAGAAEAAAPLSMADGRALIDAHAADLLGPPPADRHVRVMVTMPTEAADDYPFVRDLVAAGMDCARINCGHDGPDVWGRIVDNVRRASAEAGRPCRVLMDLAGPNARTGPVAAADGHLRVRAGDVLVLTAGPEPGRPAEYDTLGRVARPATVPCTLPEVLADVKVGDRVLLDDGKVAGVVRAADPGAVRIEVTRARAKGEKVRAEQGINLPDTRLRLSALTAKDVADLAFVARRADLVGYSFVRTAADVADLRRRLAELGAERAVGVVLKIESREAFANFPDLLLEAMRGPRVGAMIARGDMAVEGGFERLAEVQEEILWICEAAHVPVVWATEVLTNLAKKGRPTRGEITDAAMAVRAECVMLNKGPYILDTIRMLDDILRRMQDHQEKKMSLFRELRVASRFVAMAAGAHHDDGAGGATE